MKRSLEELYASFSSKSEAMKQQFQDELESFYGIFEKYLNQTPVQWDKVLPPSDELFIHYLQLDHVEPSSVKDLMSKVSVLKLNGGLGTSMGCSGPKSLIQVRGEKTFLDMAIEQIECLNAKYNSNVELHLMNSFNTNEVTLQRLSALNDSHIRVRCCSQSRYPRVFQDSFDLCPKKYDDPKVFVFLY